MRRLFAIAALHAALAGAAEPQGFTLEMKEPPFRVAIPALPAMEMKRHPFAGERPHLRLIGESGPYTVSVITPTADPGMGPEQCARSTAGTLSERPGVPKQVMRVRLDADTYLVMYPSKLPGGVQLHAHLLSAAGGTHCVEVHASRVVSSEADIDRWFKQDFREARIAPGPSAK